jgi:hypothetical protein
VEDEIKALYAKEFPTRMDRWRAMRDLLKTLYRKHFDDGLLMEPYLFEHDDLLERYIASRLESAQPMAYRHPSERPPDPPDGPMSPRQEMSLKQLLERNGINDALREKILFLKFGKRSLGELTRNQTASLMAYLNSPAGQA